MPNLATFFLGMLACTALLAWAWERQRNAERARTDAAIKAAVADAINGLKAELQRNAEYTAAVKLMGMYRNVAETRAAEPDTLHPIKEHKLAEAALFDLAEQRNLHGDITKLLNEGKGK